MKYLAGVLFIALSVLVIAQNGIPDKPKTETLVTDFADVLSAKEEKILEQKLLDFYKEASTQIALVTVKTLNDYEVGDFATQLAEKWGIGMAKYDNGVLMVFKPKIKEERGQIYIATGYGLEGAVPDIVANRITDDEMIPYFKQGKTYEGLNAGIDALILATKGEYQDKYIPQNSTKSNSLIGFLILSFAIAFVFWGIFSKKSSTFSSSGKRKSSWTDIFKSSGNYSGSYKDFTSSSGSFSILVDLEEEVLEEEEQEVAGNYML